MPMRPEAFERLYAEHAKDLLGFLVYKTGDRYLAEDLLVDTFERVLRGRTVFDRRRGREKSWLYSIALNLVRDHARRRSPEARALDRSGVHEPAGASGDRPVEDRVVDRDAV